MTHKLINFPTGYSKNKRILAMAAATGRKTVIVCNRQELRNQWLSIWTDNFKDSLNTLSTVMSVHQFYGIASNAPNQITESIIVLDIPQGSATEFSKVLSKALANNNEVWIMDVYHGDWKYPLVHNITNINAFEVVNELNITEHIMSNPIVPAFKPEGCRPFNALHAQDGAPYGMKDTGDARITAWDRKTTNQFKLAGLRQCGKDEEIAETWDRNGIAGSGTTSYNLVMRPLGYCQGRPVHVGDTLTNSTKTKCLQLKAPWGLSHPHHDFDADSWVWPDPEPEMPKLNQTIANIHDSYGFLRGKEVDEEIILTCMRDGLAHALKHQLPEIIDYINACGITIRPPDFWVSEQGKAPIISYTQPQDTKYKWRPVFYDAKATSNETRNLGHLSNSRLNAALEQMNQYESQDDDLFSFQSFIYADTTKKQIIDELEERKECPF